MYFSSFFISLYYISFIYKIILVLSKYITEVVFLNLRLTIDFIEHYFNYKMSLVLPHFVNLELVLNAKLISTLNLMLPNYFSTIYNLILALSKYIKIVLQTLRLIVDFIRQYFGCRGGLIITLLLVGNLYQLFGINQRTGVQICNIN